MNDEMNITSAQYVAWDGVNDSITATIDGVEWSIPLIVGNTHYDEITVSYTHLTLPTKRIV